MVVVEAAAEDEGGRARRNRPANHSSAALVLLLKYYLPQFRTDPKWIRTRQPQIVVSKNMEGSGGVRRAMEVAAVEYGGGNAHRGGGVAEGVLWCGCELWVQF